MFFAENSTPSQIAISQLLYANSGSDDSHLVYRFRFADVVLAGELALVLLHVLRRQLVKRAIVRPLEHRPEGLDSVGVHVRRARISPRNG